MPLKILQDEQLNIKAIGILLNYCMELYHSGTRLIPEYFELLVEYKLITANEKRVYHDLTIDTVRAQYSNKHGLVNESALEDEKEFTIATGAGEYKASDFKDIVTHRKLRSDITKSEWDIPDQINPPKEFVEWINSVNKGWQHKITYEPYNVYKEQATNWLREDHQFPFDSDVEEQLTWLAIERKRCLENSMYSVSKYGIIPDTNTVGGELRFHPWDVQCFLLYLTDCGLSFMVGKPRQVGSTTVIALASGITMMLRKNFTCILVAQKGTKSEQIFKEKIKFPITHFPDYIKPSVANWNELEVNFQYKGTIKGSAGTHMSTLTVLAPAADVVNAGSPDRVLLDEAGLNELLDQIILQGRPTMFRVNPDTGQLEMKRQLICWGTADTVSEVFESEFKAALENWENANYSYGIIPIFLNSFSKPGFTWAHYEREKAAYYSRKKEIGKPDPKVLFHQTYPIHMEDMFITTDDTVIPKHIIKKQQERVLASSGYRKTKRGYFEPIYDTTIKVEQSDVPFKVIGARFIPAKEQEIEEDSVFACVRIIDEPQKWLNRYYSGVDPIFSASGHSKMANAIWDSYLNRLSAFVNFKAEDYRFCYLQSLLLTLYYSPIKTGKLSVIKSLLEINTGGEYNNYTKDKGFHQCLTKNRDLPDNLQTGTVEVGIRKNNNSKFIVNKLEDICNTYANNIDSPDFWIQIRTYVKKHTPTGEKFCPKNIKTDWDDLLDATVYSKINADCHDHITPISLEDFESKQKAKKPRMKYVVQNGQTILVNVETMSYGR